MEQVYRGYPMRPYMIYDREMQSDDAGVQSVRNRTQAEYEYFRGLYPLEVRKWQRFVEEEIEQSDHPGSMIYDEYPDRETLYVMRERILGNAGEQGVIESRDVVTILMLHEILRRRAVQSSS